MTSRLFDAERGLYADTPSKDQFSEHAQCNALNRWWLSPEEAG